MHALGPLEAHGVEESLGRSGYEVAVVHVDDLRGAFAAECAELLSCERSLRANGEFLVDRATFLLTRPMEAGCHRDVAYQRSPGVFLGDAGAARNGCWPHVAQVDDVSFGCGPNAGEAHDE